MLSHNQIIKLSKMFIGIDDPCPEKSLYDHIELEDDLHWNYTLMSVPPSEFLMSSADQFDFTKTYEVPLSPRSQIRHHDCMWSGRCTTHPEKLQCNNTKSKTDSLKKVDTQQTNQPSAEVTPPPQQQQLQQPQTQNVTSKKVMQEPIPAGRSLLINSRLNQPKPTIMKIPSVSTNDFLKEREFIARPDTPLSLDEDPPEFKHTIDLAACTMGSNKMSLVADNEAPTEIINMLKEHLQDQSGNNQIIRNKLHTFMPGNKTDSLSDLLKDIKSLSDFEDMDEDESAEEIDSDTESSNGNSPSIDSSQSSTYEYNQTMHSDHSYTRSKNRVDVIGLGVQTPSDSEEEIDVVSVSDKTLPTNPTAKDRRELQTTVAHKISARIVKTSAGVRTIPPRRRCSVESESSSPNTTPTKSYSSVTHSTISYGSDLSYTTANTTTTVQQHQQNNRKRQHHSRDEQRSSSSSSTKRFRGKKQRMPAKRQTSDTDETDTIEKRNLHNDMERQRRIGLKNLFEELKRQIPGLKDKERAPKVSILREASNLCKRYNREEEEKIALKKLQTKLYNRVSVLRTSLAAQRSRYMD